jgi:hypothetical protein
MDDRLQSPSGQGSDLGPRGNLLGPVIRRDIADLNLQFLRLSLEPSREEDPRFAFADTVRRALAACTPDELNRLAMCPFSLFQLHLPDLSRPGLPAADRVAEARQAPPLEPPTAARCQTFVLLCLSVARQLAGATPFSPRIALGVSAEVETRLAGMGPSELAIIAAWSGLVRARWPRHDKVWGMLIAAARDSAGLPPGWAHCAALCLLATGATAADLAEGAPVRRRGRPVRGGPGPGVPC